MKKLFVLINMVLCATFVCADTIWIAHELEKFIELNNKCYAEGADADISPCKKAQAKAKQLQKFALKNLHASYKIKLIDESLLSDAASGVFNRVEDYFSRNMQSTLLNIDKDSYAESYKILYLDGAFNFSGPQDIAKIKKHVSHLSEVLSPEDFDALNIGYLYEFAHSQDEVSNTTADSV